MRKLLVVLALVTSLGLLVPRSLFAQAETGQIAGTITDPSGGVVPNATVSAENLGTHATRTATTGPTGGYILTNLLPGTYVVTVEAKGFAKFTQNAEVAVGTRVPLDIQLSVGATATTIEVTAGGAALVSTQSQTVSQVVDTRAITELPTLSRDPYALVQLASNVSPGPADFGARGVGYAINGLRGPGTNILLDGAANNDEFTAVVGQSVPLDSVQEFSIITNNMTAEYGRADAGVVNVVTKSGTNDFHGTAYEFNRISKLTSTPFYSNAADIPKGVFTRNQFGYSVGGPAIKDKLFFFNNTEWIRIRSQAPIQRMVIDPALIPFMAANSQNYFSGFGKLKSTNRTLGVLTKDDLGLCTGATTPVCTAIPGTTPFFDKVTYSVPSDAGGGAPRNEYQTVARVDWSVSERTQVYGRYARQAVNEFTGYVSNSPYEGFDTGEQIMNNNFLVSMTRSMSPNLVSQSKIVFNRLNDQQPLGANPAVPGLYFGQQSGTKLSGTYVALPGYLPTTPGSGIPFGGPQNFIQLYEDVNYTHGAHSFRFGGSYEYLRDNRTFGAYETPVTAVSSGSSVNSAAMERLITGFALYFRSAINPQGKYPGQLVNLPVTQPNFSRSNRYNELAFYGQDSWKAKRRLTLNLGMRWEYYGVQHNKNPMLDSNFYEGPGADIFTRIRTGGVALAPQSPIGSLWVKHYANFAPRLGFAYDVFGDGKTSFRGGYSIGYERNFGNVTFNVIQNPPNYATISLQSGVDGVAPIPITTNVAGPLSGNSGQAILPSVSLRNVEANIKMAYAQTYSLTVEHEITRGVVLGVDYNGSKGTNLYDIANINQAGYGQVYMNDSCTEYPCPFSELTRLRQTQYTDINRRGSGAISKYNGLTMRFNVKNVRNWGLSLQGGYTWSHTMDDASTTFSDSYNDFNLGYLDPFNPKIDYGNSYFDIRQRFSVGAVWQVPFARDTKGVAKQVLDGWEIAPLFSATTGTPFSIWDLTNSNYSVPRLMVVGAGPSRSGSSNPAPLPDVDFDYFNFINIPGSSYDTSYFSPITGLSDTGPWPNMTTRGAFRGPGVWNLDLGLYKRFKLTEKYSLQFRFETYNTPNHSNLYADVGSAYVAGGGDTFIGARRGQTTTGGDENRNVQLALKFIF